MDPEQLTRWFGPAGFETVSGEIDLRVGRQWRFDFIAPGGQRYTNRMKFLRIEAPRLLEIEHGLDQDHDHNRFRVAVTFDEQGDGQTVLTLRQLHPTKVRRDAGIGFGAVAVGYTTLDKLAAHLDALRAAA